MPDGRYELPLYVSDKQIIERMGVGIDAGRKALQAMRLDPGFPTRTIGGKRYWPSVVDFLDRWNGRLVPAPFAAARDDPSHEQASAVERRFAAIERSIDRPLDPALMNDSELRAFLVAEDVRMSDKASRRRPSLEASMIALAESRLRSTHDKE